MVCLLYRQRSAFSRPHTKHLTIKTPEARKVLILFLSDLDESRESLTNGIPDWLKLSYNLEQDIREMERLKLSSDRLFWRWEMPLRAIRHHSMCLQKVIIVCSDRSILQVHWFAEACRKFDELKEVTFEVFVRDHPYLRTARSLGLTPNLGWNFESFDELSYSLWKLIRLLQKQRFQEDEITIDFTGGQKVTSVVAAAITFNRNIDAQYVQTNPYWKVFSYDVISASSDTGDLGL
jgi:hypothetical protein